MTEGTKSEMKEAEKNFVAEREPRIEKDKTGRVLSTCMYN